MRISLILAASALIFQLLVDTYLYLIAKRRCHQPGPARFQLFQGAFFLLYALVIFFIPARRASDSAGLGIVMWMVFGYLTVYAAKLTFIIFDLAASVPLLFRRRRLRWLSRAGIAAAAVVALTMLWGAFVNRKHIQINEVNVKIASLPDSFNGYRVAQISDLHLGTFGNDTTFISQLVDSINALQPNIIVFTGDLVNQRASEAEPFIAPLGRLEAPDGVFSILGNHDYGDYVQWPSETEKEENMEMLMDHQIAMGWELLTNSSEVIYGNAPGDSIVIVGVENWGDPPFPQYGNIDLAYPTSGDSATKILLTHNPRHWTDLVAPTDSLRYALTLSGHTHAMHFQIGRFSPAQFRYPDCWGGLYTAPDGQRHLYVNIGAGTVGFPMRIGATPEITLFTLTK